MQVGHNYFSVFVQYLKWFLLAIIFSSDNKGNISPALLTLLYC